MKAVRCSILALLLVAGGAVAANLGFLKDAPVARFSDADWESLRAALAEALDEPVVGESHPWASSSGKAHGSITVLGVMERDGRECRQVRMQNHYEQRQASGVYVLCRVDGVWKLAE